MTESAAACAESVPSLEPDRIPFALRPSSPDDLAFLAETWKRSALGSKVGGVPSCAVLSLYGDRLAYGVTWRARRLLALHGARVACDPEAPGVVLGWACVATPRVGPPATPPLILWVYVRDDFRGQGIARALLEDLRELTALTAMHSRRAPPLPMAWRYSHFANEWALNP